MRHSFRIGTRRSRLAMRQTELIVAMLRTQAPDVSFEIVPIDTQGDRDRTSSLHVIGGKGVFVKEIERELETGAIDFAAHSLKDVQPTLPDGLVIGCVPVRDSPFDCLLGAAPLTSIDDLPRGARVGTNSQRRQAQLLHRRPDLEIVPIRGNIDTRIRKVETERLDAVVLAEAGLNRLRPDTAGLHRLTLRDELLPAAGQGAMAVECRADDDTTLALLARIDDAATHAAVRIERDFMRAIGGNCTLPIGAYARLDDVREGTPAGTEPTGTAPSDAVMTLDAMIAVPDGSRVYRARSSARITIPPQSAGTPIASTLVESVVHDLHAAGSPL